MSYEFDAPETLESGSRLDSEGSFHFVCTDMREEMIETRKGPQTALKVDCEVVDGTTRNGAACPDTGKTLELTFWHPKPTDKNEGEFARQKQAKLFVATGLMGQDGLSKSHVIDLEDAIGSQFIAEIEKNDSGYMDLVFSNLYHVDDSRTREVPKDPVFLAKIPATKRLGQSGNPIADKNDGEVHETKKKRGRPKKKAVPEVEAKDVDIDLDDL